MSTTQLLNALRSFFAKRGAPTSITSDNGLSFLLGEEILRAAVFPVINDFARKYYGNKRDRVEDYHALRSVAGSLL